MPMRPHADRMPLIDALKAVACVLIVLHHLAFYGPMSDAAYPLAPGLVDWLYGYGRMAVQAFLVLGGFLAAMTLAPQGARAFGAPWPLILRRYQRLVLPCLVALAAAIVSAAIARQLMSHPSIPDTPSLPQLLAHTVLLHDLLDQEALSAGIWYVAIDLQLYALAVAVFVVAGRARPSAPGHAGIALVVLLTAASLFWLNRHAALDETALYFAGSYGLGLLAFRASRAERPGRWLAAIALLGLAALMIEFRERIAVALATALLLGWSQAPSRAARWPVPAWLARLGQRSYSVFLIHFPVCLLVNATVHRLWPGEPWINAAGMGLAFVLSLAAAGPLYRHVESRSTGRLPDLRFHAGFVGVGLVAAAVQAL